MLLQAIVRDVSKRKETEEMLRNSERIYRDVVENEVELIARFLPDGTHIFVNEAYCRYYNKSCQDIIGKKMFPRIPKEDHREIRDHFASLNREHPSASHAHRVIMPDGSIRWQRWSDRALFSKNGILIEYQSVGRDITENKQMEEALELACQKMNLLSSITRHDILNQLTVLSGYLALSEEFTSDEKLLGFIKKEEIATERINQQIAFTKEYQDIGVRTSPNGRMCMIVLSTPHICLTWVRSLSRYALPISRCMQIPSWERFFTIFWIMPGITGKRPVRFSFLPASPGHD